jgi:hypothetical protein
MGEQLIEHLQVLFFDGGEQLAFELNDCAFGRCRVCSSAKRGLAADALARR